jgi:hypothetical protein
MLAGRKTQRVNLEKYDWTCATAPTTQHIITSSILKFGASSLTRHLDGYGVMQKR